MGSRLTRTLALATLTASLLPACATRPENVAASHVSASRYSDRTCKSLARELDEVQDALRVQASKLNDKATQDAVVTGVGVILFWPALFALGNNGALEGDVARLKGEDQAIRRQMRDLECEPPAKSEQAKPTSPAAGSTSPAVPAAVPPQGASATAAAPEQLPPATTGSMLPVPARRGEGLQSPSPTTESPMNSTFWSEPTNGS